MSKRESRAKPAGTAPGSLASPPIADPTPIALNTAVPEPVAAAVDQAEPAATPSVPEHSALAALYAHARDLERNGDHAGHAQLYELIVIAGSFKTKAGLARRLFKGDLARLIDTLYGIF